MGIKNHVAKETLTLYPNPFDHEIHINFGNHEILAFEIYDHLGKTVVQKRYQQKISATYLNLDFLPQGVYQIQFETSEQPIIKTLIKL